MRFLKFLYVSATVGVSVFCIEDQFLGIEKIQTDGLEPDLPKGSYVLVQKYFEEINKGDIVLLRDIKAKVSTPKKVVGIPKEWIKLRTNSAFIQKIPQGYCWFEDNHNFGNAHRPQDFLELKSLVGGKILYGLYPFNIFAPIKKLVSDDPFLNVGQAVFDFE